MCTYFKTNNVLVRAAWKPLETGALAVSHERSSWIPPRSTDPSIDPNTKPTQTKPRTRLVLAGSALALLAAVRRLVARLLRHRLERGAAVRLGLLSAGEGYVGLRREGGSARVRARGGGGARLARWRAMGIWAQCSCRFRFPSSRCRSIKKQFWWIGCRGKQGFKNNKRVHRQQVFNTWSPRPRRI